MNYETQMTETKNSLKGNNIMRSFNTQRGFGVEIEFCYPNNVTSHSICDALEVVGIDCRVENYNHTTRTWWKMVPDNSIDGTSSHQRTMEIVSPILFGIDGMVALENVLTVLNAVDSKVNKSMGVHVHHDLTNWISTSSAVSGLTSVAQRRNRFAKYMNNLISLVAKYEHCIFKLLPPSRQAHWCHPVRRMFATHETHDARSYRQRLSQLKRCYTRRDVDIQSDTSHINHSERRYCGLNFDKLFSQGSVEFRYHQGSTNFEKISNWIVFTQAFVETAEYKSYICYTDALTRISCNSALSRLRCDLGLRKANNDEWLKRCDTEIKRRYHLYKNNVVRLQSIRRAI